MANPKAVSDELGEYFEVENSTTSTIDLKGYRIYDGYGNSHVIAKDVNVAPGAYAVLARNGDPKVNGGVIADYVYDNFFLSNSHDAIKIDDPKGKLVASVEYTTSSPWPSAEGVAIELKDLGDNPADPASWQLAKNRYGTGDLGTPGGPNGWSADPYTLDASDLGWQDPDLGASLFFSYFDQPKKAILSALATAKKSVHIAMFNLRDSDIISALGALAKKGVDVQILLDAKQMQQTYNQATLQAMKDAGLSPVGVDNTAATNATMHDKFTVIDDQIVLTGSMNYSGNALKLNDEELLRIDDPSVASLFDTEFGKLKAGTTGTPTAATTDPVRVLFGTEDKLYNVVADEIRAAKTSVYVAMFSLDAQKMIDELIAAKQRGVHVVVVLDKVQADASTADEQLDQAGIPVLRYENNRGSAGNTGLVELHNKLCVIDDTKVLMGSYNWTNLASFYNDENMLELTSPRLATEANSEIAQIINAYDSGFDPSTVGFSTGTRSVDFSVRGLTLDAGAGLYLVGNVDALGADNYALALPLTADTSGTTWHVSVDLPAGATFNYQIIARNKIRHNHTEPVAATSFTVPYASGTALVDHAFGKTLE